MPSDGRVTCRVDFVPAFFAVGRLSKERLHSYILLIAHNLDPLLSSPSPPPMKFLRRKDTKSDTPPPPPVISDKPPQLDALPPPPPPLYARFATGSSFESLHSFTATPRPNAGTSNSQSRNSVAPSVRTTSTKSSDATRATAQARPAIKLASKPRNDNTTTPNQSSRTEPPTTPPTPAYRRETSSSEGTRLVKPRPPSTTNLPNPFLPALLRQRDSGVDFAGAECFPSSPSVGTQQDLRDAAQKRVGESLWLSGILGRSALTKTCARFGHAR